MDYMKTLFNLTVIMSVLFISYSFYDDHIRQQVLPEFYSSPHVGEYVDVKGDLDALVRVENQFGICSGVVVDNIHVLTAAHCVVDWKNVMIKDVFIRDIDRKKTISAQVIAVNIERDIALIRGNFNDFKYLPIDKSGQYALKAGKSLSCGFPYGQDEVYCTAIRPAGNMFFKIKAVGIPIFRGCSGGPVIDIESGKVIGVNSAVAIDSIIIAPLTGWFDEI